MHKDNWSWVLKDRQARHSFAHYHSKKIVLKSLLYNPCFSPSQKLCWALTLRNCPKSSSQATFRRACMLTSNPRSVFRLFKLGRHALKKWVAQGQIQGLRKASF